MSLTEETINELAGKILNYCPHDWSGEEAVEHYEVGSGGPLVLSVCVKCGAYEDGGDWEDIPDFCSDLYAARTLFLTVLKQDTRRKDLMENLVKDFIKVRTKEQSVDIWEYIVVDAKTITLACLATLGYIKIKDAKEVLNGA